MNVSAKENWLINPWVDTFFLICFPVVFFLLAIGAGLLRADATAAFDVVLLRMHFMAGCVIVYLNRDELRKKFILYTWGLLLVFSLFLFFKLSGYAEQTSFVMFYSIVLHEWFQFYFITLVFYLTRPRFFLADAVLCSIALLAGPAYTFLRSFSGSGFDYFGQVRALPVHPFLLTSLKFIMLSAIPAFIARQIYCYLKWGRIHWFAILMVLTTNLLYYLPLSLFQDKAIFFRWNIRIYHSLQYLAWVFFFCCLKFKEKKTVKGPGLLAYLASPRRILYFFGFLWLISYLYKSGITVIAGITHSPFLKQNSIFFLVPIHLYLDIILWWNTGQIAREILSRTPKLAQNELSSVIDKEYLHVNRKFSPQLMRERPASSTQQSEKG